VSEAIAAEPIQRTRRELPPGPRAPATVNTIAFIRRPLETLLEWQRCYGDVFTVKFLVFGTGVYVADPAAIKELFTGDQSDLRAGEANQPLSPLVGNHSVLTLDGPEHMRQRKLLLPPFQGSAVQAFREVIRDVAAREIATWKPGSEIVMRNRMRALTFEVICRAVFGVTERDRVERLRQALIPVVDTPVGTIFIPERLRIDLGPISPWGKLQRRLRHADSLLYEEIERRRGATDLDERSDVLSLLLRARDEEGNGMSDLELRDELMTMLAAGHETTATGLAFAFDLLLRNPEKLGRLRDEMPNDDAYLNAVVTESLRLRPVIDAVERTLTKPRHVGGYELPPGIRVYPAIALVHRREDLYPQADEFRPERFLEEGAQSYAWLPFGGGIRRCIGAALAQAEMAEVIRSVLGRVELEPVRSEPEPVVLRGITLAPRYGTPVRVVRALA
jgi:cytochrome P450 family 135